MYNTEFKYAQNGGRSFIQLRLALPVETAVNSGPFTICPKDTSNVEEHNIFSLDGAMLAFDAVNIDFSLSSDCNVYNPFVLHTSPPTPHPSLPPNLHPVREQILIPHHPALDALLWPSVREKLICVLHLSSHQRPPITHGTRGEPIQRLIHDIYDYSSGYRVHSNTAGWSPHHEMAEESCEEVNGIDLSRIMPGKGRRETLSNTALVNLSQRKKVGRRAIYLHSNLNLFKTLISSLLTANDQATNPAKHRTYSTMLRQR
ncbi:hypothetical protein COCSADRAFT_23517 [Bipolaris sorokiniana ND90Pr]|uniref:Uncharacterized protein n=1 Tax=Cochliobolus sativus (strain ND90Pr / ATCC 201652) TaxID=665912 RepID=M2SXQ8_COCSN|nr:uncharacterized protein COCSADRAFT_23517 [Bipolaris sorokiniana ND90Pr]EMD67090.1 hypothetical protein COCSADRAFT_23517 [Bipolaris sorokiniana ND90Pr]